MSSIKSLCLFCGSRPGADPAHADNAAGLGRLLAGRGITLVYGGGAVGLMGLAARAAKEAGGKVVGVLPRCLERDEIPQKGLDALHVTETLHERKALMHELSDGFVVLPGGIGTLDELFETLTWRELGLHSKPIWLLGPKGYWEPLLDLLRHFGREGFAPDDLMAQLAPLDGLDALASHL